MSCNLLGRSADEITPDWKAYALGEMSEVERCNAEMHAAACSACAEEFAGLKETLVALSSLREEDAPRRIAFVSDKVFEPRWWEMGWQMFLRPAFAGSALLAGAILVHAFVRPVGAGSPDAAALRAQITQEVTAKVTDDVTRQVEAKLQGQMNDAVNAAVTQAVAETRQNDDVRTAKLLAAAESRYQETAEFLNKQVTRIYAMNSGAGVR